MYQIFYSSLVLFLFFGDAYHSKSCVYNLLDRIALFTSLGLVIQNVLDIPASVRP